MAVINITVQLLLEKGEIGTAKTNHRAIPNTKSKQFDEVMEVLDVELNNIEAREREIRAVVKKKTS